MAKIKRPVPLAQEILPSVVVLYSGVPEHPERCRPYVLDKTEMTLGSGKDVDIQLPLEAVERYHAQFRKEDDQWWLYAY